MFTIDITNIQAQQSKGLVKAQSMKFCFVLNHQAVFRAHQSHFCLRVIAEDRGFQNVTDNIWNGHWT